MDEREGGRWGGGRGQGYEFGSNQDRDDISLFVGRVLTNARVILTRF